MSRSLFDMVACSCGATFRSAVKEAHHRHNFPLLCRPAMQQASASRFSGVADGVTYTGHGNAPLSPQGRMAVEELVKAAAKARRDARNAFDSELRNTRSDRA